MWQSDNFLLGLFGGGRGDSTEMTFKVINTPESSKSYVYQQVHFISVLENLKIHIKIYIKTAPTCFGLRPSSGSLHMSLAKVTFIKLVKVRRYGLCGCVAAYYIKSMVVFVLCAQLNGGVCAVSSSRNVSICWSSCCTIYESNSSFVKSEYS